MKTPHLYGCVITSVLVVAPLAVMTVASPEVRQPIPAKAQTYEVMESAAANSWQPPNVFDTLGQIQKLGVTGVDILIPASGGGTSKPAAVVVASGVSPSTAATATAAQQKTVGAAAAPTPTPTNPMADQINAYLKQLAASMAAAFPTPSPSVIPPGARQIFAGDYNTGNFTQWAMLQAKGINAPPPPLYCTYSACVTYGGIGHETAARYEVRDGDVPPFGGGERVEVLPGAWHASRTAMVVEGDERWYTMSIKFEDGWQNPRHGPDSWFMVTQWFPQNGTTVGPALTLQVTQDNYLELGGGGAAVPYRRKIAPVRPGQWVDYTVHVKFSEDPNVGYVEVYENGKLVVEKHNRPTLSPGGGGAYIKQGVYRDAASSGTQVVWFDGLKIYEPPPATTAVATTMAATTEVTEQTEVVETTAAESDGATEAAEKDAKAAKEAAEQEAKAAKEARAAKEAAEQEAKAAKKEARAAKEAAEQQAKEARENAAAAQDNDGSSATGDDEDDSGSANETQSDNESSGDAS